MSPPINEVALIAGTLSITAVISALAGYVAYRLGWMNRSPTIRFALLGSYTLACALTFFNVWVTARLMFTDQHDLLLGTVLLVFAGAIAIALGYILSSSFIERINELDHAAQEISAGNLYYRIQVEGKDELARLATNFNQMAEQLKNVADKQEQLDNLRRELIAWVGHDLQTPLTSVSAIVEALADGVVDDKETEKRYLKTAQKEISALSHLIDDLFQMAQMDAGGLKLNIEPVNLSDLISDTLESYSEVSARQGVSLSGEIDINLRLINLDAQRINRVLNNLIDNAIRHTPKGGKIHILACQNGKEVHIVLSDSGVGIPKNELPHIFERFYRSEKSRSRSTGGSGLGLAISKGIIEAHGGGIDVTSEPGKTVFTVRIPLS
jgi:signal transduction histidine kinase